MGVVEWVIVAVVVIGVVFAVFGWDRYRGSKRAASNAARATNEVFTDPSTGKLMRVWYNPTTGEREYRPD